MSLPPASAHPAASEAATYRALFDGAYDAILLYDEHGRLFDCNQRALELLGTTRPLLLSAGLMAFIRPDDSQEDYWSSEEMLEQAIQQTAQTGLGASRGWHGQRADDTLLDAWVTLHRLKLPEQRPVVQLTLRDVTQNRRQFRRQQHQEAAAHHREQLREVLSRADLGFLQLDRDARVVDVNDFFLQLTGYNRLQVLGQEYFGLFAPEAEREPRRYAYRRALEREELQDFFERSLLAQDRHRRTVYWYADFVRDAEGQIDGVMFLGRDVSKGQFTARALGESQSRLQDFLDNAHDLIQNLSIDNRFLFVNKAWKEKLGYADEDLSGLSLTDVVHPYYKAKLLYQLRNLYKGERVNKLETVFLTKTGKPVHLIGSITCSWDDGEPVSTRAILHDITDRIKAERLQKVYYSIANLAISSKDLHSLYGAIHRELSKIIETNNFYIALCDEARTQLQFAYFVDQNSQGEKAMVMRPFSTGVSEYIIRTGKPQILLKPDLQALIADGTISAFGLMPEVMLCSPLSIGDRIIGVIAVQDYAKPDAYAPSDLEILHFISNQVALAIERKRNEVQINKQNARLNAIFESGTHLMWSVDLKSRLTSFNRNYAAYFLRRNGVHPALNVNLWHADLAMMEEDARQLFIEHYTRAFEGVPQRFEVRLRDVRGHDTWREIYLNPIYLDDGTFEEISGIAHDITDKKRSQLEMAAQEEKFRAIFESFQDIYYRTDEKGVITIISPSVVDIVGYEPEEVVGHRVADYYQVPDHRADLVRELETGGGVVRNFETALVHKDGHIVKVLVNARALYDELGRMAGIEGIARDVTDFKQMQDDLRRAKDEAETALHAKTQFLANMSHELRTPMNGIIGMIDLLHQTVASEEQEEYIDTLRKSSDALLAILNDILDLSKIQAGKMELNEEGMDLHYTLEKIHSLFANRAQQKHLDFTYEITPHTPRFIITDETRLLQVLSNLTSNAIKFTQQGRVTVRATSVFTDGVEHTLRFEVKDSGIGISTENAKLLFTNFTQLDTTPTKSFGGTGLGLAISKQLTELMGGQIGVDSTVGEGATFWFTIRCRVAENEEAILQERQAARDRSAVGVLRFEQAPRVLLVDDNPINQKVAVRLLDKLGCRTDVAGDGFEAIGLATSGIRYDVIFMDIQMPEMDGVTAMREIRRRLGPSCPPVVAMTAYSMKEDAERFVQEGMDDYVPKPVKSQDLYEVLGRWRPQLLHGPAPDAAGATPAETAAPVAEEPAVDYAADQRPIIDMEIVEQLRQLGGADFAAALYADFEQEAGPLLEEARGLVEAGQYADILPQLHQLKGTGFTLGLTRLAEQAKHLEHDLKQGRTEHATRDFQALLHYFAEFIHEYPARTIAP